MPAFKVEQQQLLARAGGCGQFPFGRLRFQQRREGARRSIGAEACYSWSGTSNIEMRTRAETFGATLPDQNASIPALA